MLNEFLPKYIILLYYVDLAECGWDPAELWTRSSQVVNKI